MVKMLLVAAAMLATTAPSFAAGFWVIGKPYALYQNAEVQVASYAFGRLVEVNEVAGYVVMDNVSTKPSSQFMAPRSILLDGNDPPALRFPTTKQIWWSLKSVAYAGQLDKLP